MPVYNSERFIRQALDSLLAQDYPNFELIISDNASTDMTQQICLEYGMRDKRVKYYRQKNNIGVVKNFNWLFKNSSGDYFMWAAYDDMWAPTYISRSVDMLEKEKNAVLCFTHAQVIDNVGHKQQIVVFEFEAQGLREKIKVIRNNWSCLAMYGLIRRKSLEKIRLFSDASDCDYLFLIELHLLGNFIIIPEVLFYYRHYIKKRELITVSEIKRFYYGADKRWIPPYPFFLYYFLIKSLLLYLIIILKWKDGPFKKILSFLNSFYLYPFYAYNHILYYQNARFYYYYGLKDTARVRQSVFFCILSNPLYIFNYDFCCILLEAIAGKKFLNSLKAIKQNVTNHL